MKMKPAPLVLALLAAAAPLGALEISLEENRGERGSIGFVDLQAVFRRFPETRRAKQSYSEIVRQAEEQLNLRKAELIRLRSELAALKAERDAAAAAPIFTAPPPVPAAQAPEPAPAPIPETAPKAGPPGVSELPGMSGAASTEPLKINIPGVPEEDISTSHAPPPPETPAAAAVAAPAAPTPADLQNRAEEDLRRRDAKVKELAASVAAKTSELADKEAGLGDYQVQVEQNLVSIEAKRSEILLGRIYKAVREAAIENAVSVVIDKSAILFGQGSVDLTDKVLKKLEGTLP